MSEHKTRVEDATKFIGYGPAGHGTWWASCTCGWQVTCHRGGKNAAEAACSQHRMLSLPVSKKA